MELPDTVYQNSTPKYNTDYREIDYSNVSPKYSTEFRDVIYKINPYNLSCVYKKMFEKSALKTLQNENSNVDCGLDENRKQSENGWATSIRQPSDQTTYGGLRTNVNPQRLARSKGLARWSICPRSHTAGNSGYQRFTLAETREFLGNRSQSACAKYIHSKPNNESLKTKTFRSSSTCGAAKSISLNIEPGSKDRVPDDGPGSTLSLSSDIPFEFEHFRYPCDHMRKYRDGYTFRRLDLLKPNNTCTCDARPVPNLVSVTPMFRCFETYISAKPKKNQNHEQEDDSKSYRKKSPVRRRKKKVPNDDAQKSPHFLLAQDGVLKMEFFSNPLTVSKRSSVADKAYISPSVFRTRPTIPSNAHGSIYPTSTDTQSYFVQRQK